MSSNLLGYCSRTKSTIFWALVLKTLGAMVITESNWSCWLKTSSMKLSINMLKISQKCSNHLISYQVDFMFRNTKKRCFVYKYRRNKTALHQSSNYQNIVRTRNTKFSQLSYSLSCLNPTVFANIYKMPTLEKPVF